MCLSPSSIILSTFGGLQTVYASCSLPEPCFFTVLTPAAKRKIGSDNPLLVPKLLPLNEHILLPGIKLIPMIPESNRSSKECCAPQRAKLAIRLGFRDEPELRSPKSWCYPASRILRLPPKQLTLQMSLKTPICLRLGIPSCRTHFSSDTIMRPLNFPLQLRADCKCYSYGVEMTVSGDFQVNLLSFQHYPVYPMFTVTGFRHLV